MKQNILLIDDDQVFNFLSTKVLQRMGVTEGIHTATNGRDALDLIKDSFTDKNFPDIIFLDINMPNVDGFVFLYEFEKFNELVRNKCKVIILSSSDNKRDIDKIVNNNHVIKFITKPLTEVALDEIKLNNI